MAYSRDDIDLVRERTDLVALAAEVTKVKRSGRKCGEAKPITEYFKNRCKSDGLSGACKPCKKIEDKKLKESLAEKILGLCDQLKSSLILDKYKNKL